MERINEKIAENFIRIVQQYRNCDEVQSIKIRYSLCVLLGEVEKLNGLSLLIGLMGNIKEFLFILLLLFGTKRYIGGIHMKTHLSCFLTTFLLISGVIFIGNHSSFTSGQTVLIYLVSLLLAYRAAPMKSENRIITTKEEKYLIKSKAVLAVGIISVIGNFSQRTAERYILWTLLLIQIEVLVGLILQHQPRREMR